MARGVGLRCSAREVRVIGHYLFGPLPSDSVNRVLRISNRVSLAVWAGVLIFLCSITLADLVFGVLE